MLRWPHHAGPAYIVSKLSAANPAAMVRQTRRSDSGVVAGRRRRLLLCGLDSGGGTGRKIRSGIEHQKAIRRGSGCRRRRGSGSSSRIRCWRRRRRCGAFVRALCLCQPLLMTTCFLNTTPLPFPQIAGIVVLIVVLGSSALNKKQSCKFLNI